MLRLTRSSTHRRAQQLAAFHRIKFSSLFLVVLCALVTGCSGCSSNDSSGQPTPDPAPSGETPPVAPGGGAPPTEPAPAASIDDFKKITLSGTNISAAAPTSAMHSTPTLAFDNAGNAVAAWLAYTGTHYSVLTATRRSTDATWSTPLPLVTGETNEVQFQLAANGSAFAFVSSANRTVFAHMLDFNSASATWGPRLRLGGIETDTDSWTTLTAPRIASSGTSFVVTWVISPFTGAPTLHARRFDGSQWGEDFVLAGNVGTDGFRLDRSYGAGDPILTAGPIGYAIAWHEQTGDGQQRRVRARTIAGGTNSVWSEPVTVSATVSGDIDGSFLQAASSPHGHAVLWAMTNAPSNGSKSDLFGVAVLDARISTTNWSEPLSLTESAPFDDDDMLAAISSGPDGFAVAWLQNNGGFLGYDVLARIYAPVGNGAPQWSDATSLGSGSLFPGLRLASNNDGHAIAWRSGVTAIQRKVYAAGTWSDASPLTLGPTTVIQSFAIQGSDSGFALLAHGSADNATGAGELNHLVGAVYAGNVWSDIFPVTEPYATRYIANHENPGIWRDGASYWFAAPAIAANGTVYWSTPTVRHYDTSLQPESFLMKSSYPGSAIIPQFVENADGDVLAVWEQFHLDGFELYASLRQGQVWSAPVRLSAPPAGSEPFGASVSPYAKRKLITNADQFSAMWEDSEGPAVRFHDGAGWSETQRLRAANNPDGDASWPDLAAHAGGFALAWTERTPTASTSVSSHAVMVGTQLGGQWTTRKLAGLTPTSFFARSQIALAGGPGLRLGVAWSDDTTTSYMSPQVIKAVWLENGDVLSSHTIASTPEWVVDLKFQTSGMGDHRIHWLTGNNDEVFGSRWVADTNQWANSARLAENVSYFEATPGKDSVLAAWVTHDGVGGALARDSSWLALTNATLGLQGSSVAFRDPSLAFTGSDYALVWTISVNGREVPLLARANGASWSEIFVLQNLSPTAGTREDFFAASVADQLALTWTEPDATVDASIQNVLIQADGL